jgi:N4-(beta-N-acetylglucosaminyl)-L-asparaginase
LSVRQEVGAVGSTGRGESTIYNLSSFAIVEAMRRGAHPKDAGMAALRQIVDDTINPGLLNVRARPSFNVKFYVVSTAGECAGVALYGGDTVRYAVCTENGAELRVCDALLDTVRSARSAKSLALHLAVARGCALIPEREAFSRASGR